MELCVVVNSMVRDHSDLQARLAEWEAALAQLTASSFFEAQRGWQRLWRLVPYFEKEVPRHFQDEEDLLFPAVAARLAGSREALAGFAQEHRELRRHWQEFKSELLYGDAVGETQRVYELGTWLRDRLIQHMRSEERFVRPLVETN